MIFLCSSARFKNEKKKKTDFTGTCQKMKEISNDEKSKKL